MHSPLSSPALFLRLRSYTSWCLQHTYTWIVSVDGNIFYTWNQSSHEQRTVQIIIFEHIISKHWTKLATWCLYKQPGRQTERSRQHQVLYQLTWALILLPIMQPPPACISLCSLAPLHATANNLLSSFSAWHGKNLISLSFSVNHKYFHLAQYAPVFLFHNLAQNNSVYF